MVDIKQVPLSLTRRAIVNMLMKSYPRDVPTEALVSSVYSGARRPKTATSAVKQQITFLRLILRPHGWTIPYGKPGRNGGDGYRLERIKA